MTLRGVSFFVNRKLLPFCTPKFMGKTPPPLCLRLCNVIRYKRYYNNTTSPVRRAACRSWQLSHLPTLLCHQRAESQRYTNVGRLNKLSLAGHTAGSVIWWVSRQLKLSGPSSGKHLLDGFHNNIKRPVWKKPLAFRPL